MNPVDGDGLAELLLRSRPPVTLRRQQRQALDAVEAALRVGRTRAWVVLPPGAGKTLLGLETIRLIGRPALVLGPNTAIVGQWVRTWRSYQPSLVDVASDRSLDAPITVLSYQSLAVFDPDADEDASGDPTGVTQPTALGEVPGSPVLNRLHPNGRALVDVLRRAGPITIVLDECHHLLEVWGRLLAELLELLPDAFVLGLTATPPDVLDSSQATLVDQLFGSVVHASSIPAAVREGALTPFAELAWFTEPSSAEVDWLAAQAERFAQLTTDLLDPTYGSISLLSWLDLGLHGAEDRMPTRTWAQVQRGSPDVARALLRAVHAGLLAVPAGARLHEDHRQPLTAEDWVSLVEDWVRGHLSESKDPTDAEVLEALRAALPGVGYTLTSRGIRRGRSPVDRVLARSAAKSAAALEIVDHEARALGERLRLLVLCDHERASATIPAGLRSVLAAESGSARRMLADLVADDRTHALGPVLVTGRTVAAAPSTSRALVDLVAAEDPALAATLVLQPWPEDPGVVTVSGQWTSRSWVRWATEMLERGQTQVLVGTRALLGEGWDARGLNSLIDLGTATTTSAVVQTRGRTLRIDPAWPDKVALTWSVVAVSDRHPRGDGDWDRLVRKHLGYYGVDDVGDVVAGVAHVDGELSPYAPPPVDTFDMLNARTLVRAQDRRHIRGLWAVGTPYDDHVVHTVRVRHRRGARGAGGIRLACVPTLVVTADGPRRTADGRMPWLRPWRSVASASAGTSVQSLALAVADGMSATGLSPVGAAAVVLHVEPDGEQRFWLGGVDADVSLAFATALDEVVSAPVSPRYLVPRYVIGAKPGFSPVVAGWRLLVRSLRPDSVVWHAVPTCLGVNAEHVDGFVRAWNTWVSGGTALFTQQPEGAGVLAAHRGADPLDVSTVMRTGWS